MPSITFTLLGLENFMSIEGVSIELDRPGAFLLRGKNEDSIGADDNGAGKSSIFEGLRWVLYGETVKQTLQAMPVEHVIRTGETKAAGHVCFKCAEGEVAVTRTRTKSRGTLHCEITGLTSDEEYRGAAAQEKIDELLGVDKVQFSNLVHLCGSYPKLFARATDQDRKDILAELVEVSVAAEMREVAKREFRDLDIELGRLKSDQVTMAANIATVQADMVRIKADGKEYREELDIKKEERDKAQTVQALAAGAVKVAEEAVAQEADESEEEIKALEEKLDELFGVVEFLRVRSSAYSSQAKRDLAPITKEHTKLLAEWTFLSKEYDRVEALMDEGKCPECGQETCNDDFEAILDSVSADMHKKKEAADAKHNELAKIQGVCDEEVSAIDDEINDFSAEIDQVKLKLNMARTAARSTQAQVELAKAKMILAEKMSRHSALHTRVEQLKTLLEKCGTDFRNKRDIAKQLIADRAIVDEAVERISTTMRGFSFWKEGFSSRGVPSLYIETVLPKITEYIQKYADVISGGDLTVRLRAFKANKSGSVKEAIQIAATNFFGADVYGGNSKGEKHRIDMAVTLGLIEYFRDMGVFDCNLIVCDEVFEGLDYQGRLHALDALSEAHPTSRWVISHLDMPSVFDKIGHAIKKDGVTNFLWSN